MSPRIRTSKRIRTFGSWVATTYGLECLSEQYYISKEKLREDVGKTYTWIQHMADKDWVNMVDFREAYVFAMVYYMKK